ncbi:NAD+ synthase [Olivibacter sp. SDN3]|uniref:NAD+ synthase n=1 Tax=Olivibacter sp. SDN3 TaxID=2764720 RepID=UPI0016513D81|nr:NAD+ synthase [Olivibacter sp. SDN3]QNL50021.1 NAD+ synthase [Olivibacter sp. SDN3]
MIVAIAQLNYHIGNFEENTEKIIDTIYEAKAQGADLVVFSELIIGGYLAKDLLKYSAFLDACEESLHHIAQVCDGIACIVGAPIRNSSKHAKSLFNAAIFIADQEIKHIVHKTLLPDYDIFDEHRYFEPNNTFKPITFKGVNIALTICEDLWNSLPPFLYKRDPMKELSRSQPDVMINIAASPFSEKHFPTRLSVVESQVQKYEIPAFYVNGIGAHAEIIFDGRSMVFDKDAHVLDILNDFAEDIRFYKVEKDNILPLHTIVPYRESADIARIHQALVLGIKDFFGKSGFQKAILGLSGGIDSAVVAALACEALGAENVMAVLMPSIYSTDHSIKDAIDLVKNTGCLHEVIPIGDAVSSFERTMAPAFKGKAPDITEENIQARVRAIVLMAMSNKHGYILLNTSNKSEAAVGYGTLYGDMAGALGVIGDVFKTKVYELARYINRSQEIIPENTIVKAPSAELRPDQKDADSLPDYAVLDEILYQYIELERSVQDIINRGFADELVKRIVQMVVRAEFKRFQSPPILRVTRKAFGTGRSMPLVAHHSF